MVHRDGRSALRGGIAGIVSATILQPLEVLKINLILLPKQILAAGSTNPFKSFFMAIPIIYKEEGVKGFYRGSFPSILSSGLSATLFFFILHRLERISHRYRINEQFGDFMSSATARALASVAVNPLNIWKTRAEILGNNEYRTTRDFFTKIYRQEGLSALFKGNLLMILRDFPFGGIFYVTYKAMNSILHQFTHNKLMYLFSGFISGAVATTVTHPMEIILAKVQVNTEKVDYLHSKKNRILTELGVVYKTEGMPGLFKGLFPRLIRKPITNALTFFLFELLDNRQKKKIHRNRSHVEDRSPSPEEHHGRHKYSQTKRQSRVMEELSQRVPPTPPEITTDIQSVV